MIQKVDKHVNMCHQSAINVVKDKHVCIVWQYYGK